MATKKKPKQPEGNLAQDLQKLRDLGGALSALRGSLDRASPTPEARDAERAICTRMKQVAERIEHVEASMSVDGLTKQDTTGLFAPPPSTPPG